MTSYRRAMAGAPQVAVVIPTYDSGGLLRRAVRSVESQSLQDWEIVVVDDGSSEDLTWVAGRDPRIRLLSQPNRGVSVARNVGVAATSAKYLCFLDQDDEWAPDKLTNQLADVELHDARFGHTGFTWVWEDRELAAPDTGPATYRGLLGDQYVCLSTVMVHRELFQAAGGFDPVLRIQQDFDFDLRALIAGPRTSYTPGELVRYHVHQHNASADYALMREEGVRVLQDHARLADRRGDEELLRVLRRALAGNNASAGAKALQTYRSDRRTGHLYQALRHDPRGTLRGLGQAAGKRGRAVLGRQE